VPTNTTNCASGYGADYAYCQGVGPANCNNAGPTSCVAATPPNSTPQPPPPSSASPIGCGGNPIALNTAIGCIPFDDASSLIGFLLRWAIGIGGGIAFLLIIIAGFQIITSSGNPEKLQAGKELLTSAIAGILLLIFSVFILELIGVDILKIPGFNQ
jgi:hypothetical protein